MNGQEQKEWSERMTLHERKDWDTYFMDIAYMASTRSRCPRRFVGAVLVKGKKLLGTAYNGAPMGVPDCCEEGCMIAESVELEVVDGEERQVLKQRCVRTIHAEQNLMLFTNAADRVGATVYVTDQPCWTCANILANSGIAEIVFHRPYRKDHERVSDMLAKTPIVFRQLANYAPPLQTMLGYKE
jgi:dCMP deaminase